MLKYNRIIQNIQDTYLRKKFYRSMSIIKNVVSFSQKAYHNLKALKTKELLPLDLSTRTQWKILHLAPTAKKHIPNKALLLITNILHLCSVESDSLRLHELYHPPGSSLLCPWNFPGRILEWIAISFSRGSSQPRDQTRISCLLHWQVDSLPLSHLRSPIK